MVGNTVQLEVAILGCLYSFEHSIWKINPSVLLLHVLQGKSEKRNRNFRYNLHFLMWNECITTAPRNILLPPISDGILVKKRATISPFWQWHITVPFLMPLVDVLAFLSSVWFPLIFFLSHLKLWNTSS